MRKLTRPWYRAVIIVHVASSVAWLGLSLCLLVLGVTALGAAEAAVQFASVTAMSRLAGVVAIPIGSVALASGVLLTLGTRWSLAYKWTLVKLAGTAIAFVLTIVALRPGLAAAAAEADPGVLQPMTADLIAGPIVSSGIYLTAIVLSYVKPWGRVGGRRPAPARVRAPAGSAR